MKEIIPFNIKYRPEIESVQSPDMLGMLKEFEELVEQGQKLLERLKANE